MENEPSNKPDSGRSNEACGCGCASCGSSCSRWCGNGKWHKKHWKSGGHGCHGGIWFAGWLFTVGFLKLAFWKGALALVVWPYFLGSYFAR